MDLFKINTPDSFDYQYFPITKSRINLTVMAANDARIALQTHLGDDSPMYEITIGGWGNTMSSIKRNNTEPDVVKVETLNILNQHEAYDIWIQWCCDGLLNVGRIEEDVFMSYKDKNPFIINYIGFSTAWGATGEWLIEECQFTSPAIRQQLLDTCHYWEDFNDTFGLPDDAVLASDDGLYIGRSHHKDSVTPGGIRHNVCTIPWGGAAHEKKEFQVLCGKDIKWVKAWEGSVPSHAIPAGETENGYALFVGRVMYDGVYYIGKIQPNHQVCYVPLNGQEIPYVEYDALVVHDYYYFERIDR